ncbi:fibronectin type III domain-containing protein [Marinobacter sp. M3C]|uniref:fibronectin type III domain-containing protein n=1 Tax=Marinobacter sp. M3C TaxID=2917715 RepID=UPI00200CF673|nr:fibronectin type III domain-containing protein [Marinobacter sp. M3C]UQG60180.1 fibronectin type III domain-containing protein [Marinobacter sp. M3C]
MVPMIHHFVRLTAAVLLCLLLTACGGEGDGKGESFAEGSTTAGSSSEELYGTATLSWQAPLNREDGGSLAMGEIGRYEVRYGLSADLESVNTSVQVEDGQRMSYTVEGLSPGTWYFAIQTVDIAGLKSEWSEFVSKVIKNR